MARTAPRGTYRTSTSSPDIARPSAIGVVHTGVALALLRVLSSYSWLNGAFIGKDAKFAPDFLAGSGLTMRITDPKMGFTHTAAASWVPGVLTGTVVPHAALFAWLIALGELGVSLSLVLDLFTRLGGLFAIVQAIINILVAGGSSQGATEVIGHNYMLALAGLVVIVAAAGRAYGLDRLLIARFPTSRLLRLVA